MPRAILFDLDDTLFDHHQSSVAALRTVHERFAPSAAFTAFERHHTKYLEEMHIEVLAGRIEMNEARRERFRRVFRALGLDLPADRSDAVAMAYRTGYLTARRAMEGAAELLAALQGRARIGIVSNNLLDEQVEKLQFCGLDGFVDALVVSEEAGVSKPDPAIFRIALDRVGAQAEEAVMVGDSWAADIVGARRAGIRAIWFNRWRAPRPADDASPVEEIAALTPVGPILSLLFDPRHVATE
ncbi:MAG TPA: HAD family hydrolase [Vicinamibacterales bacterium]|jgi:putative hydrolase of the HAD superfamily